MLSLTDEQIAFIESDIEARGIKSSGLHIDLLDHICCIIESELADYSQFHNVYEKTIALFGSDGLHEIQKETNRLLIFKHYYIMNSIMKISGYVSASLILLGTFFKFSHWPGASLMLFTGMVFMTLLFLPLMFILKFKSEHESNRSITLSIIGCVSAISISVGILFKFMHWPGAATLLYSGFGLLMVGYLPIYLFSAYNKTSNKINAVSTVVLIAAGVGLLSLAANTGISKQVQISLEEINKTTLGSLEFITSQNRDNYTGMMEPLVADSSALNNEGIKNIRKQTEELANFIANIRSEISVIAKERENITDDYSSSEMVLFSEKDAVPVATKLKAMVKTYANSMKAEFNTEILTLQTNDVAFPDGSAKPWEYAAFDHIPVSIVLHRLAQLELEVRTTEALAYARLK